MDSINYVATIGIYGGKRMNTQAKVIFASFIYFAMFLDLNKKASNIPEELKRLFRILARLTKMYSHNLVQIEKEMNDILKNINKDVDYLLLSVTIIAEYYEQTKGKKRLFTPMSWEQINNLQNECLELSDKNATDTFDVAELIVKELLK